MTPKKSVNSLENIVHLNLQLRGGRRDASGGAKRRRYSANGEQGMCYYGAEEVKVDSVSPITSYSHYPVAAKDGN